MTTNGSSRERVLKLFAGEKVDRVPVFSGMGNVTVHGLKEHDYKFAEIHTDARKMADAAASTYRLFGFECAVVPFDMGIEAEALGCQINYYSHREEGILYPTIKQPLAEKVADLDIKLPSNLADVGRVPVVTEAIHLLKAEFGDRIAIGSYILGPYLIAAQVVDVGDLAKACFKKPDLVNKAMEKTSELIISLAKIFRDAGSDYITIREMGAGPDILSPRIFKSLIMPHLKHIFASIDSPNVLHICGDTNSIVDQMGACGADAISVEEKNNMAKTRSLLGPDALIFGNVAGYNTLAAGKPEDVDRAVKEAISNGTSAVWPGCDIWPDVPEDNIKAMMAAVEKYGKL
jgi:[methyl-Co(III) methanol-specific corrinoid protein]:coenzyme M methyltransferase